MNLIVISTLGGLHRAQNLIKQENLQNNVLAILYTPANLEMPKTLTNNVADGFFDHIEFVCLQKSPTKITLEKSKKDFDAYKHIFDKYNFTNVFLNSFDYHYNYLAVLAQKKGAKLILFEEGTGTYNYLTGLDRDKLTQIGFAGRMKIAITGLGGLKARFLRLIRHNFIIKTIFLVLQAILFIPQIIFYLLVTIKRVFANILSNEQKIRIRRFFYPNHLKPVFGKISEFDELYLAFPEMGKKGYKAKKYNELKLAYYINDTILAKLEEEWEFEGFTNNDIIFVDQIFSVPVELHLEAIFSYINKKYPNKHIYMKLHPKMKEASMEAYFEYLETKQPNVTILDTGTTSIPMEYILQLKNAKHLIGLSSTTLVNAQLLMDDITVLSFMDYYINYISRYGFIDKAKIDNLKYHKAHLEIYNTVKIV